MTPVHYIVLFGKTAVALNFKRWSVNCRPPSVKRNLRKTIDTIEEVDKVQ